MVYSARGPAVANSFDPKAIAHCARVGVELGADIVKVSCLQAILKVFRCSLLLLRARGDCRRRKNGFRPRDSPDGGRLLTAGGSGISIWAAMSSSIRAGSKLVKALRMIVHESATVDQAPGQHGGIDVPGIPEMRALR